MSVCQHCGQPVKWEAYWETWDHAGRESKMFAELCEPANGFHGSTYATPRRNA